MNIEQLVCSRYITSDVELYYNINTDRFVDSYKRNIGVYTVHQAKGLEWDVVLLIGCNNKYYNYKITEEDKRVEYVATTRAKDEFIVTYLSNLPKSNIVNILEGDI